MRVLMQDDGFEAVDKQHFAQAAVRSNAFAHGFNVVLEIQMTRSAPPICS